MATIVGSILVALGLDSAKFKSGLSDAEKSLRATQKQFDRIGTSFQDVGAKLTAGVTLPFAAFAAKGIAEAKETAAAMAQVNAAIESMGNAAGRSSEQLTAMADKLEMNSLYEADEILRKVTANLLTFGNISGEQFDKAQQAVVDLATRMNMDLQAATILVGKALNDPVKGITALTRAGIQFTTAQKEQIKSMVASGNAAGAQTMILKELQKQYGGAAAAAQNADPYNKLTDAFNQMAEKIGAALLPILPALTDAILSVLNAFSSLSPETQKWILIAAAAAAAIGPLLIGFGGVIRVVGQLLPLLTKLGPIFMGLVRFFSVGGTAARLFFGALAAGPKILAALRVALLALSGPIGWIIGALGAVYLAWRNWDKIEPILRNLYNAVKAWLWDKLSKVFNYVKARIKEVADTFFWLWDVVVGHSYVPDLVEDVGAEFARLDKLMVDPADKATKKTAEKFRQMAEDVRGLMATLFPEVDAFRQYKANLALIDSSKLPEGQKQEARQRLYEQSRDQITVPEMHSDEARNPLAIDYQELDEQFLKGWDDRIAQLVTDFGEGMGKMVPKIADLRSNWEKAFDSLKEYGGAAFDAVASNLEAALLGAKSFGDAIRDIVKQLASMALQALVWAPLKAALGIPGFATGTNFAPGGMAIVGEKGPELVNLPRGSEVVPNHRLGSELRGMGGAGGPSISIGNINFPNITNPAEAREAAGQFARRLRREMNGPVRSVAA